jgi:hypothetical protein
LELSSTFSQGRARHREFISRIVLSSSSSFPLSLHICSITSLNFLLLLPVYSLTDERDAIQKKTFTKWVNNHLKKTGGLVTDLFVDLRDGHNLLTLLELLSNEKLVCN